MDIMEFIEEYYIWLIVAGAVIIFAVIGFFADKSRTKKKKEKEEAKKTENIAAINEVDSNETSVNEETSINGDVTDDEKEINNQVEPSPVITSSKYSLDGNFTESNNEIQATPYVEETQESTSIINENDDVNNNADENMIFKRDEKQETLLDNYLNQETKLVEDNNSSETEENINNNENNLDEELPNQNNNDIIGDLNVEDKEIKLHDISDQLSKLQEELNQDKTTYDIDPSAANAEESEKLEEPVVNNENASNNEENLGNSTYTMEELMKALSEEKDEKQ